MTPKADTDRITDASAPLTVIIGDADRVAVACSPTRCVGANRIRRLPGVADVRIGARSDVSYAATDGTATTCTPTPPPRCTPTTAAARSCPPGSASLGPAPRAARRPGRREAGQRPPLR